MTETSMNVIHDQFKDNDFINACKTGKISDAMNMIFLNEKIDFHECVNNIFTNACYFGYLDLAKKIYGLRLSVNIDLSYLNDCPFRIACEFGHLELAKWLYSVNKNLNISNCDDHAFRHACYGGHLEVVKWLYSIKKDIDISRWNDNIFRMVCLNGKLELAKYLIEIKPDIDISLYNELAFRKVCEAGHLELAKWLLSIKEDIDITAQNDDAFKKACANEYGDSSVALWLKELRPDRYEVVINEENKIILSYVLVEFQYVGLVNCCIEKCSICLEKDCKVQTKCKHSFCKRCLEVWLTTNTTCPYCREHVCCNELYEIKAIKSEKQKEEAKDVTI